MSRNSRRRRRAGRRPSKNEVAAKQEDRVERIRVLDEKILAAKQRKDVSALPELYYEVYRSRSTTPLSREVVRTYEAIQRSEARPRVRKEAFRLDAEEKFDRAFGMAVLMLGIAFGLVFVLGLVLAFDHERKKAVVVAK